MTSQKNGNLSFRERLNVPVASGSLLPAIWFGQSKYDFPILICYAQSISDDFILILIYLPYFEDLIVFVVMAIAGRQWATKAEVMEETEKKAITIIINSLYIVAQSIW